MKAPLRALAMATGAALVLLCATRADAFCRSTTCRGGSCETDDEGCPSTGKKLYWAGRCIGISIQNRLTQNMPELETRIAVQESMFAWADADCGGGKNPSLTFQMTKDVACDRSEYRKDKGNVNVVVFRDDDWLYKDVDNTLAKTTVTFNAETGEILDADIEVNTANNVLTVGKKDAKFDFQSIMTHEFGHLIGLAHSPFPSATMFASYEPGSLDLRSLAPDDVAAVCAVYPPDRKATCDITPRNGFDPTCSPDDPPVTKKGCTFGGPGDATSGAMILAGLLVAASRRARRVRR